MPSDSLRSDFLNPPPSFRGAPFWSWNDRLQVAELVRQVHDMKAHGMGGFFMHSREGLETSYLSPEWMECIRETVRAAKEAGQNAWLYDEDRWPSGFAGGRVPAHGGDAFRAKLLTVEETPTLPEDAPDALALFAAVLEDGVIRSARRIASKDQGVGLAAGETYLVFRCEIMSPIEWFNDDAYADNLNPESVRAFLDITYEAYRQEVGAEFGKTIPGIFTDEPNIFNNRIRSNRRALPWTWKFEEFFQERRGWDLRDGLPWLFYPGSRAAKARHDFWWTVSERFTTAYSRQIGEWCGEHGLAFTGHFLYEQEMGRGVRTSGAIMPHYRYQQVPGIDMLTEQNREFLTIKQCTSVASQLDRKRVLSETYGCSGWEFTFEGQKWNGDWQYVLGVNLRAQHLALYTLRGCRKRDYPPAFNYNTTWWKYNGVVEDYFARVGLVMSQGQAVRDVLVIHPVATAWSMLGEGEVEVEKADAYSERLNIFVQALLATHYDFDFGDEQIMALDGRVEGKTLVIGRAPYPLVIIPPETRTLLRSTVDLLVRFLATGGQVLTFNPPPAAIEAEPAAQLAALWNHPGVTVLPGILSLQPAIEQRLPRRVSLVTPWGQEAAHLLYMQRQLDDGRLAYFIVNNDRQVAYDVQVEIEGAGALQEWDPLSGQIKSLPAAAVGNKLCFSAHFGPAGSKLYVVDPHSAPLPAAVDSGRFDYRINTGRGPENAVFIGPDCPFTRTDPNVLTLDTCRIRLNGGEWSPEMEVWRAQQQVREALGMRQVYYNGLPQRHRWALIPHPADGALVELRFTFQVQEVPTGPVDLLLEGSPWFAVTLNGVPVANPNTGLAPYPLQDGVAPRWYLDRAFHRLALPSLVVGVNELGLVVNGYTNYMELEDCYLIGDFGVSPSRVITAEPQSLHFGDWTSQGYFHYPGGIIYRASFNHEPGTSATLFLGETRAVDTAIHINGRLAGHIPWVSANGFDLTPHLRPGANTIGIEVVSSPRNMLGPLHRSPEHESWTDWRSFRRTDQTYTPGYVVAHWGLYGQVKIVIQEM